VSERRLVALDGSPRRGSSVDRLLEAMGAGAHEAGGGFEHFRAYEMEVKPCIACGPEPTTGYCIFHDAMDPVYAALERAHAVVVGTPIYFDTVSAPLKLVIDRCNCVTMLLRTRDGSTKFRPQWRRTRRGVFVAVCGERDVWNLAERTVRGFMKWTGTRWEETLVYQHDDNALGSVEQHPELLARAHAIGRRLIESPPLEPVPEPERSPQ
jgi:multimeric flavodoxin WrbA